MSISGRTRGALIEVTADAYTHDELDVLFLRLGLEDDYQLEQVQGRTKLRRVRRAVELLEADDHTIDLARELIEVKFAGPSASIYGSPREPPTLLVESLRLDGLDVVDWRLLANTPEPASLGPEISVLEQILEHEGFDVTLSHYQQAVASFVDGRLEASNGQLRSALEAFLLEVCARTTGRHARGPGAAVDILRESEILDGSEGLLLKGLVGVSNDRGAHQGLTDGEEALFRLHFTTAAFRYLLARGAYRTDPRSS